MKHHHYFVYIVTNDSKKVLYIGVTNNLLYFESFKYIDKAIQREKEIKGWTRKKKEILITSENPEWKFLNSDVFEEWPPRADEASKRG